MSTTTARGPKGPTDPLVAEIRGASKNYGSVRALTDVDFTMQRGEVRALLGKNGAGKSTLIRMLSGAETPDTGEVLLGGQLLAAGGVEGALRLGVRTVYQELSLIDSMSVAENMFMGQWPRTGGLVDYRTMTKVTRKALARLELEIDPAINVEALSLADQQMVEIARALRSDPQLLILDEPTSSLAAGEVERVLTAVRTISASGVAVIYVSHRLSEIRQIACTASVMRDGRLIETCSLDNVTTGEVVRMMIGNTVDEVKPVVKPAGEDQAVLVEIRGVSRQPLLNNIDLDIHRGEVLGIAGVLGSGRTELLRIVAGLDKPAQGQLRINGSDVTGRGLRYALGRGLGMTPEDRKSDGIFPQLGVAENMVVSDWSKVSSGPVISPGAVSRVAKSLISRLHIKTSMPSIEISTLSGGNQQKAVIGRWLHADSTVLLLDEPTRGVDVEAKAQIYILVRALAAQGRAVVFVSSEIEELPSVCDRVVVLRGGTIIEEHLAPNIDVDQILASAIAGH